MKLDFLFHGPVVDISKPLYNAKYRYVKSHVM